MEICVPTDRLHHEFPRTLIKTHRFHLLLHLTKDLVVVRFGIGIQPLLHTCAKVRPSFHLKCHVPR
jgi:hypothetical protein